MKPMLTNYLKWASLPILIGICTGIARPQTKAVTVQMPAEQAATQIADTQPAQPPAVPGPKLPGKIRLGVVSPKTQLGQGNTGADLRSPLRALIVEYLTGPSIEIVPIQAMLPSQIDAEAKEKDCDYELFSSLSQKQSSSNAGMFRTLSSLAPMIPMLGGVAGAGGAVAATAAASTAAAGAASLSSGVKAKGEISLEYKLVMVGKEIPVLANTLKAKAKQDGEDVVSPLVEQTATAVLAQISAKQP